MTQLRPINLQSFWRSLPDWYAPVGYGAAVFAIVAAALAVLTTIGGSPGPHTVTPQVEHKRVAERAPTDTPETAPQLSPVYPTMPYEIPASTGQADLARKLAREGQPQAFTPDQSSAETSGYSPRFVPRRFRPEPLN